MALPFKCILHLCNWVCVRQKRSWWYFSHAPSEIKTRRVIVVITIIAIITFIITTAVIAVIVSRESLRWAHTAWCMGTLTGFQIVVGILGGGALIVCVINDVQPSAILAPSHPHTMQMRAEPLRDGPVLSIRSGVTWSPLLGPIRAAVSLSSHAARRQRGVAHCGAAGGEDSL